MKSEMTFLSETALPTYISKGDLAESMIPSDVTYDYALPQSWVDECRNRGFDGVAGQFVWVYDGKSIAGFPFPLTLDAVVILAKLARCI